VDAMEDGSFLLGVHIADVSHYVDPGSALDLEAYRRGTSVYFPDRAVPMLPEALSNGLCSLRPEVPRLTLSAFLRISPEGEVVERRFAQTVIRSARRLTYSEVRRLLEEPKTSDAKEYGEVLPLLETARELMKILYRQRLARGSIDFDLPEGNVILDSEGFTVGVRPGERSVAHRIIEECMIAANEAVAYELESHELPALYRIHDPPSRAKMEELKEILQPLGIALKGDLEDLHPSAFQKILRRVEGKEEEPFVSSLVLRAMNRALYDPECRGHYALGSSHYTHFTSPIRRYPDLLVHRGLKGLLDGRAGREAEASRLAERLPGIAEHTSTTERRAERSERDLLQWKLVRFLAGRIGEEFSGRVTGVQPFGLFVQLADYYVDGLVPIRTLADDFYVFDPEAHRLVGQEKERVFRLADEVRVQLAGVNPRQRGLELKVVGMPEPRAPRRRRPRGRRGDNRRQ
ncbi:MAG: VacB/RNase II family 3'-5' exoribonuclease, partial [Thermoanaerobaculia bacterium]